MDAPPVRAGRVLRDVVALRPVTARGGHREVTRRAGRPAPGHAVV